MKFADFLNESTKDEAVDVFIYTFEDGDYEATLTFNDDVEDLLKDLVNDLSDDVDFFKPSKRSVKFTFTSNTEFTKVIKELKEKGYKFKASDKDSKTIFKQLYKA